MKTSSNTLFALFLFAMLLPICMTLTAQADSTVGEGDFIANGFDFPNGCVVDVFDGGTIGLGVDLQGGELNVFGGQIALGATSIASGFTNTSNIVNISGGNIGPFFQFFNSTGFVTGGTLNTFGVFSGSEVTIEGGTVTGFPDVFANGTVNIRGGSINSFRALSGSTINIEGTQFFLDSKEITLMPGEVFNVSQRDQTLSATLSDGSPFTIFLRSFDPGFPSAPVALPTATINLVGAANVILGDVNGDEMVDLLDVAPFVQLIQAGGFNSAADINQDGVVDLLDVNPFVELLTS